MVTTEEKELIQTIREEVKRAGCNDAKYCSVAHNIRILLIEFDKYNP